MKSQPDGTRRVQWGTASNADTTTGQTDAEPTDTGQMGILGCAGADSQPLPLQSLLGQLLILQGYDPERAKANRTIRLAEAGARIAGTTARLALAPEALHPIIELHSPSEHEECQGCDGGPDYSGDWPCRTIELILEGLPDGT